MKKIFTLVIILLLLNVWARAQHKKYIVSFIDKKGTAHTLSNPSTYLSARAIERRIRQKLPIDSTDLPVSKAYLDSVRQFASVQLVHTSKWLNQALISTDDGWAVERIKNFPFVKSVRLVSQAPMARRRTDKRTKGWELLPEGRVQQTDETNTISYGNTYNQIHLHKGEYLHDLGFTGRGISIAVLDAGFNAYKTNPAFDSVRLDGRILGEWDFVENNASVNEDHFHGANCLSIMAANRPGVIVGSAPHASYWLLRTEDAFSETLQEEVNWATAAEFADSAGADIISSSLGYIDFDDPADDHSYAERDGKTTLITRAANMAARKGMIVVNSAGNNGMQMSDMRFVGCPADGDSVLAVGGTDGFGNLYLSGSWGPNSAGRVKPNVVSVAQGTVFANALGNAAAGNGTSYACPNMAGLIACLWQAFPEFTNMEIIDYVQRASDLADAPNERMGYGIPNFELAYQLLFEERERRGQNSIPGNKWIKAYPNPSPGDFKVVIKAPNTGKGSLQLIDMMGRIIESKTLEVTSGQLYFIHFSNKHAWARGLYYVRYADGKTRETIPLIRQ
jgi:serine protease AprX